MATVSRRGTECKHGAQPDHGTYFIRTLRKKDATSKRQTKLQFIVSELNFSKPTTQLGHTHSRNSISNT